VRILVATAGALSPIDAARIVERLSGPNGHVTVITVIEVPRTFLDDIRSDEWHPLTDNAATWSSAEDAVIARYVEERGARITEPLVAALEAAGVDPKVEYLEGEDPAGTILESAEALGAEIIVLGATKQLFDESQWESVSTRVIRESACPVLVVTGSIKTAEDDG
jgi:nucleotide-binding universal stress UspA family protein